MEQKIQSAEIFDHLVRGRFISANAINQQQRNMYLYVEDHLETLSQLYQQVGFRLEMGDNYFYFSRINESQQNIENKIEKALRWLDIMAFFTTYNQSFGRGFRFSPLEIIPQLDLNLALKEILLNISKRKAKDRNYIDMLNEILREMRKEGFMDVENEMNQTWKVQDAWLYLEQIVRAVSIDQLQDMEDSGHDIPYQVEEESHKGDPHNIYSDLETETETETVSGQEQEAVQYMEKDTKENIETNQGQEEQL